jgi:hypothetical protein
VAENFNPVSGGQGPGGLDRALGNLVAIQQALASPDPQVRIEALKEALHHGEEGAQLLIKALHEDGDWEVKFAAWETLLKSLDPRHVQVAKEYQLLRLRQVGDVRARYDAGERDFRWADLRDADLSGANLSGAELVGTQLRGANLTGAKLDFGWERLKDLTGTILPDGTRHPSTL